MKEDMEKLYLINRIKELEEQIEQLRLSRRILMNLLEKVEREKKLLLSRLEKENKRLQKNNYKYAHWLWDKNLKIIRLESENENY